VSETGQYIPPPGPGGPVPRPAPQPRRPAGSLLSGRGLAWTIAIVVLGVAMLTTHRLTVDEVIIFCVIVPSIILHEVSHGWVALAFGDDTAKRAGRLTLNPLAHIDLLGTVIVPGLLILSGYGWFGWAKPVPVNLGKLRSPRNQGVLVALVGPFTNAVLATVAAVAFHVSDAAGASAYSVPIWAKVLFYLGLTNVWLGIFNLLPLPPLDGSVLVERMLPARWWPAYLRVRPYSMFVIVGLFLLDSITHAGVLNHLSNDVFEWWGRVCFGS